MDLASNAGARCAPAPARMAWIVAPALALAAALLAVLAPHVSARSGAAQRCNDSPRTAGMAAWICGSPSKGHHQPRLQASGRRQVSHEGGYLRAAVPGPPLTPGQRVGLVAKRLAGGTQLTLIYRAPGRHWQARFTRLASRSPVRTAITSKSRGGVLTVRLRLGKRVRVARVTRLDGSFGPSGPESGPDLAPRIQPAGGGGCATSDQGWNDRWALSGPGWTGGDATYSVGLPDGRAAWLFGDTFLGTVNADGSRPQSSPFVRNSMVVQSSAGLETIVATNGGTPRSLVEASTEGAWFWPGAGVVHGSRLQVIVNENRSTGAGMWDFAFTGSSLATFTLPGLSLQSVAALPRSDDVAWGSWILRDGGQTYVYGTEDHGLVKYAHVARVAGTDLGEPWEYWTGAGWSADPLASVRVLDGVSNQFSVTRVDGRYQLITHESTFGRTISAHGAPTPVGPFSDSVALYTTPTWGEGTYTYNAVAHPEQDAAGGLLVSYNVNSFDASELYRQADIYRPRFVRVPERCFA